MDVKKFVLIRVYGAQCSVYLFFSILAFLVSLLAAPAVSAEDTAYLDELLGSAREMRLSGERYWDILVHYKPSGSGRKSLVDDPKFFLAPDGKKNPEAELEATIKSLFQEDKADEEHPRCRFIARYTWLKERLNIDEARLPPATCTKFNEALASINPKSAALIFPATHINSPASMFGHTLIRIDSSYRSELLSHAVNYAAVTTDSNGFLYAFKGIFGFYHGYYSNLPYYEKVSEYSDLERRDMWEYKLNLSEEEVRRMLMHIWELKDIYSDYYFFDENCSYNLLFLLEAARPSVNLTDRFSGLRFWVIPTDTIRAIKESGLIVGVKYRPSQATRILFKASHMAGASQKVSIEVAGGKKSPQSVLEMGIAPEEKAKILDLSAELLQYKYSRKQISKDDYLKLFLPTLNARSTLGTPDPASDAIPPPVAPEKGHLPGKFSFGPGYRDDSAFMEIGWRAAYHDLLDPDDGYIEGAQVNFFDLRGRYYFKEDSLRLESLRFIDIVSLSPWNTFFKPVSWKVNTGFDRKILSDGEQHLIYRVNPGGGFAYKTPFLGLSYIMLETDVNLSDRLKHDYSVGFGVSAGVFKNIGDSWKINLSAQSLYYEIGDEHRSMKASLATNYKITTDSGLTLTVSREKTFDYYQSEMKLLWNLYL